MQSSGKYHGKNVVFILTDDQGPWAMGCAGNPEIHTPNLDRMAAMGRRFENFFCASPVCSPARASILTGLIPSKHGVVDWIRSGSVDRELVDKLGIKNPYGGYASEDKPIRYLEGLRTYTDALHEAGYQLALSGKWHLGDSMLPQHGFDRWYTIGKGGAFYFHPDIIENGEIKIVDDYVTDLFTRKALAYMDEMKEDEKPFYMSIHYTAPHSPWEREQHKAEDLALYEDCPFDSIPDIPDHPNLTVDPVYGTPKRKENLQGYFAAVTAMDRSVGQILDYLEENNLLDDTLVFFMADNGMNMGHHGIWGKGNGTFPQNMYEESVKVPFLALLPGEENPGTVVSPMASQLDFYPTLMDLLGISDSHVKDLPGTSMAPLLLEANPEEEIHKDLFICEEYGSVRMIRTPRYKYVHYYPFGPHAFYDLEEDPGELNNLYDDPAYDDLILDLHKRMEAWYNRYFDPAKDGSKAGVTGLGQLSALGEERTKKQRFYID
jgi:choline-sulfatase